MSGARRLPSRHDTGLLSALEMAIYFDGFTDERRQPAVAADIRASWRAAGQRARP